MQHIRMGHLEIVELFLDQGADIEAKDNEGSTALMRAAN
jgi:ankyrin repeat protein